MNIVVLDGYTLNPGDISWEGLEELGDLMVYDRTPEALITKRIADADAVFTNKAPLSRETIAACPNLRFIGVLATGYNMVDLDAARERGIPVCNVPTYGTDAVAQFTIALLLELCHHVGAHSESVHRGEWSRSADWCYWQYPLMELAGKTLGIIGFGRIGQGTARIARALGLRILAHDAYPTQEGRQLADYVPLDQLYREADVISLHCPLLPETRGLICKESIARMKPGVLLLNAARGPLIVEEDLCLALESGQVGGAALDVVATEPIRADSPLLLARNCLLTPHIAWAPRESRQRLMAVAVDNLAAFKTGKIQNNVWDRP
ncbi:MAG: D-2-hydroxyacid dehydrogenase [Christensenellales bacterium]